MRWFRFYDDALNDAKVQRLPAPLFKAWVNVLCLASKFGGKLPELYDVAFALRVPEQQAEKIIRELVDAQLIDVTETGYEPHNWHGRQYASDSAAERMKRHRDRKRDVTVTSPVPNSDATDSDTEQIQNRTEQKVERTPSAAPTKGTRFPHASMPEAWKQFCREKRPDLDPSATFDQCRDYWIAQPGQRGVKRDWDATWRNWVRNQRNQAGYANRKPSDLDNRRASIEAVDEVVALATARQRSMGG